MFQTLPSMVAVLIPIVSVIAVFTFVSIATYAENRRKEREAYYRYEFRKKVVEQGSAAPSALVDMLREEERQELRRAREGQKLGGIVTAAVGVGLILGLQWVGGCVWMLGFIPLVIGVAILVYGLFLAPKQPTSGSANPPPGM